MKEGAKSVKRLLCALYQNADDRTIKILAHYLNYHEPQLKEDISEIPRVDIVEREE